jgi:hypothetical protein
MYKSTLKSYKKKRRVGFWFWPVLLAALIGIALLVYQIPRVNKALSWRIEYTLIYINGILHPVEALPTALADDATVYPTSTPLPTSTPQPPTATPEASPTATPQPTPIPGQANLPAPT